MHKLLEVISGKLDLVVQHMVMSWPCCSLIHWNQKKKCQAFLQYHYVIDQRTFATKENWWWHVTYNHSSMGAEVEVVVARVADLAVNDCPCKSIGKEQVQLIMTTTITKRKSYPQGSTVFLPGGTLSGPLSWKNLVWWFFWAMITVNLGFHVSSRNLHAY